MAATRGFPLAVVEIGPGSPHPDEPNQHNVPFWKSRAAMAGCYPVGVVDAGTCSSRALASARATCGGLRLSGFWVSKAPVRAAESSAATQACNARPRRSKHRFLHKTGLYEAISRQKPCWSVGSAATVSCRALASARPRRLPTPARRPSTSTLPSVYGWLKPDPFSPAAS
jgi:hypothetical protein